MPVGWSFGILKASISLITLLSFVNLIVFATLIPVVIYASLRPLYCYDHAHFLETYQSLPTVSVLPKPGGQCDDLSLYLLLLEENISELKSYKYMKVCILKHQTLSALETFWSVFM